MEVLEIVLRGYASMGGTTTLFFLICYQLRGRFWRGREAIKDYLTVFALWPFVWMQALVNYAESTAEKMKAKYGGY